MKYVSVRNAEERLTFLGVRRDDPCEDRTDEASSVIMCVMQTMQRSCECDRAERTVASSALSAAFVNRDGVDVLANT